MVMDQGPNSAAVSGRVPRSCSGNSAFHFPNSALEQLERGFDRSEIGVEPEQEGAACQVMSPCGPNPKVRSRSVLSALRGRPEVAGDLLEECC
jgi:hypothetical protein